jgi:hypothetical protein
MVKAVADFRPPDAVRRLQEWQDEHADAIAELPDGG